MEEGYCTDCKKCTEVVLDHSQGDMICTECGLVLESHFIDEQAEWRTFADDSGANDPNRVGESTNPLLPNKCLSTLISQPKGSTSDSLIKSSLSRLQSKIINVSNPDRHLMSSFETMATMSDRLGLAATIRHRANEIYAKLEEPRCNKGKTQEANMAACLLIASKEENKPRTIKEICSVVSGATKKEIGRAKENIVKKLKLEMGQSMNAGDFMKRFGSNLGMKYQAIKAAQEAIKNSEEFDIRRNPTSIVSAIIYIVTQVSNDKIPLKNISLATGVSEAAIKSCYKDLRPYVSKIIPGWYAREEDLKNLGSH